MKTHTNFECASGGETTGMSDADINSPETEQYPRSIGELIRSQEERVHNVPGPDNIFELLQITNHLTLTVIETYFKGMVGETICAYSYYLTDYSYPGVPFIQEINTVDELKLVYKKCKGRRLRFKIWYLLKNFRGWSEDPRPYVI